MSGVQAASRDARTVERLWAEENKAAAGTQLTSSAYIHLVQHFIYKYR